VSTMDALVPSDVTAGRTQILSNLVFGDKKSDPSMPHPLPLTEYLTTHFFQRRGRCRRVPGSQTRCLSSCSDLVMCKAGLKALKPG
jgi:hypothetical protein